MPDQHALFSPSGAHRWIACPASLAMEERYGVDNDSPYAQEGTAAHELAEITLLTYFDDDIEGVLPVAEVAKARKVSENGWDFTTAMAEYIQTYVDAIMEYAEGCEELAIEAKSNFSDMIEQPDSGWGTADAVIITDGGKELQMHDLKYGFNPVGAEDNKQLMLYAAGIYYEYSLVYDIETIRLVIHQPRNGGVSEWACDVKHMLDFVEVAKAAAAKAKECVDDFSKTDERLKPGESQCQWCKAKSSCPALQKFVESSLDEEVTGVVFENLDAAPGTDLGERLAQLLPKLPLIEKWIKAVYEDAENHALSGGGIPGFKVIEGRKGNRRWVDEEAVDKALTGFRFKQDERYERKLISPATAKKLVGDNPRRWKKLEALISQAPGKPKLVPESHKQPAMNLSTDVEFEDLTKSDT